jgi:hypothetical protein
VVTWLSFVVTRWLIAVCTNPRAARAIAEEAHYDTRGAAASRMLVIRGVDDEASLSLAAGSIGSRLSYVGLVGVIPLIFLILVIILGLRLPAAWVPEWLPPLLIAMCVFGAWMFFILPGVFKSVFGREFLVRALVCDIAVDSVPDALDRVEVITLPPVDPERISQKRFLVVEQLRHGIYSHPSCVYQIVRWLRRVT